MRTPHPTLTPQELAIMKVVWRLERATVRAVYDTLRKRREIAYTTVMTTIVRLYEKGLLARKRDGKRYLYSPRFSREEFLQATARDVLRGLSADSTGRGAIAFLAETLSSADEEVLDELERMIQRRRRELEP